MKWIPTVCYVSLKFFSFSKQQTITFHTQDLKTIWSVAHIRWGYGMVLQWCSIFRQLSHVVTTGKCNPEWTSFCFSNKGNNLSYIMDASLLGHKNTAMTLVSLILEGVIEHQMSLLFVFRWSGYLRQIHLRYNRNAVSRVSFVSFCMVAKDLLIVKGLFCMFQEL
jgi:hypothetical protein